VTSDFKKNSHEIPMAAHCQTEA